MEGIGLKNSPILAEQPQMGGKCFVLEKWIQASDAKRGLTIACFKKLFLTHHREVK